ncbi:unnamed protein product [Ceratitis capitata]|uniref:(Mediterranean fruit fly) hypothetical protein n=1 Tax=Ceratitis capitata TaxID=7213 RepID=A0A811V4H2_CERCA|nr:unnamed protein product [Ceratitis capitata]
MLIKIIVNSKKTKLNLLPAATDSADASDTGARNAEEATPGAVGNRTNNTITQANDSSNNNTPPTTITNTNIATASAGIKNLFALVGTATAVSAAVDIPPSPVTETAVEATTVDQTTKYLDKTTVAKRRQQRQQQEQQRYNKLSKSVRIKSVATAQSPQLSQGANAKNTPESAYAGEVAVSERWKASSVVVIGGVDNANTNSDIDDDSEAEVEEEIEEAAQEGCGIGEELTLAAAAECVQDDENVDAYAYGDFEAPQFELDAEVDRHAKDLIHIDQVFEELRQKMEVLSVQNQYQGQFGVIGSSKVKEYLLFMWINGFPLKLIASVHLHILGNLVFMKSSICECSQFTDGKAVFINIIFRLINSNTTLKGIHTNAHA